METTPVQHEERKPIALVIDDSPDVHRLLKARLKNEEVELLGTMDSKEGLEWATQKLPAVILLDLDMPGMDGFQVLRALKDCPLTHQIPVIVLSGMSAMQDKVTAFELGAVDFVAKPFEFTELRVRLRSTLRIHRLLQLLSTKAQLDGLTGLWNRAHFDQRLIEETQRAARAVKHLSVAIVDCDHFKSVNDTFGHPAGDAVLQGLAKILKDECRASDVVCRYGGEEFVLLMPETKPADAAQVCERIRAAIEGTTWPKHPERKITASFGVCGAQAPASGQALVDASDKNLYASKKGGRNRVTTSELAPSVAVAKVA